MTGHILQYRRQGWPYCSILKPQGVEIKSELAIQGVTAKSTNVVPYFQGFGLCTRKWGSGGFLHKLRTPSIANTDLFQPLVVSV